MTKVPNNIGKDIDDLFEYFKNLYIVILLPFFIVAFIIKIIISFFEGIIKLIVLIANRIKTKKQSKDGVVIEEKARMDNEVVTKKEEYGQEDINIGFMKILDGMEELLDEAENFYILLDDPEPIEELYDEISSYNDVLEDYKNIKFKDINVDVLNKAIDDSDDLIELCDKLSNYTSEITFDFPSKEINEETKEKSYYEDYNFEEEDLEEDDYYYEDDDMQDDEED